MSSLSLLVFLIWETRPSAFSLQITQTHSHSKGTHVVRNEQLPSQSLADVDISDEESAGARSLARHRSRPRRQALPGSQVSGRAEFLLMLLWAGPSHLNTKSHQRK